MSAPAKIATGALVTTALAWFLHGPLGLGENCTAQSRATTSESPISSGNGTDDGFTTGEPATAEEAAACQANVTRAASSGTINFATGGSGVAPDSAALVDQIAAALRDCSGVTVEVAGHTDAQGDAAANQTLSQQRAETVMSELVKRGVPTGQLTAQGYGETRPVDPDGPEDNSRNRRIEFTVAAPTTAA
jgi:OmpA-OmpF porin, OOP family